MAGVDGKPGEHKHEWKPAIHLDGCHFYEWRYSCECGAVRRTWAERDIASDSYSAIWMADDQYESCARCAELMAGAKPQHSDEIVEVSA